MNPTQAEVRAWAHANGIDVNPRGSIRTDVMERYLNAHAPSTDRALPPIVQQELTARQSNPHVFAVADDLAEAELVNRGALSLTPALPHQAAPAAEEREINEAVRSFAEWLAIREDLVALLTDHLPEAPSERIRGAAEALLLGGWVK